MLSRPGNRKGWLIFRFSTLSTKTCTPKSSSRFRVAKCFPRMTVKLSNSSSQLIRTPWPVESWPNHLTSFRTTCLTTCPFNYPCFISIATGLESTHPQSMGPRLAPFWTGPKTTNRWSYWSNSTKAGSSGPFCAKASKLGRQAEGKCSSSLSRTTRRRLKFINGPWRTSSSSLSKKTQE